MKTARGPASAFVSGGERPDSGPPERFLWYLRVKEYPRAYSGDAGQPACKGNWIF